MDANIGLIPPSCVAFSMLPLIYPKVIPDDPRAMIEVANEIASKEFSQSAAVQLFNLGRVHQKLESKCREIQTNTSGVWAFFRYFLNSSALTEQKAILEDVKNMSLYIEEVVKAAPSMETDPNTEEVPKEIPGLEIQENNEIERDGAITPEIPEEIPSVSVPPPPTPRAGGTPEAPPPPPPPPGNTPGAPPPPPPFHLPKIGSSKEDDISSAKAKYDALELARLDKEKQGRANPNTFCFLKPPKNESELIEKRLDVERDIERIKKIDDQEWLQEWLKEKEAIKARINQQLIPQETLLQFANALHKELFMKKIKKLTNEELFIIIGIFFNGKPPSESDKDYRYYSSNKVLLDKYIFDRWDELVLKGKPFLAYEEGWKRNLHSNLYGFIDFIKLRLTINKKTGEPFEIDPPYKPISFEDRKKTKTKPVDLAKKTVDLDELKKKLSQRGVIGASPVKSEKK